MNAPLEKYASSVAAFPKAVNNQSRVAVSQYELYRTNTGWKQSAENYRESATRRALLQRENNRIAEALERHGIQTRLENGGIKAIGEVTGQIDEVDSFRSICFLPVIAQRERKPILNGLCYFQRHHKMGKFIRLAVVTAGERIPLYGDLRGTMQKMHRDISRWAHEADKDWNVAVIYRGSEFTYDVETNSFHPHANVLYAPRKALKGDQWAKFLSWTHKRLGAHWKDCGTLEKPQEALKYPFKPLELQKLDSLALVWLYMQTRRLKIAQPMREFKRWRDGLLNETVAEEKINPKTGEITTHIVRQKREQPLKVGFVNMEGGAQLRLVEKAKGKSKPKSEVASIDLDGGSENMILCRTSPQFRFSPYAEPVTLVQNYTDNPKSDGGKERLEELRARQREARRFWDANGAPDPLTALALGRAQKAATEGAAQKVRAFNVHTSRTTVQNKQHSNFSFWEPSGSRTGAIPEHTGHTPGNTPNPTKSTAWATR